jgi:pyridoxamine 5'-phosphate oxidase
VTQHLLAGTPFTEETASRDPFAQFGLWFAEAQGQPEPTAMSLATCVDHQPSSRMVLLKEWDTRGFVFYSNHGSRKGAELERNPNVALLFFWPLLHRQIRIEGTASRTTREEAAAYFRTRARGAQVGAWASAQSTVTTRKELESRVAELEAEYTGREVPVPPYWGGYRVAPRVFEFWQGREHRLHDRLRYSKEAEGFRIERLSP